MNVALKTRARPNPTNLVPQLSESRIGGEDLLGAVVGISEADERGSVA